MNTKPGIKTTEFWLSLAAIILGALLTAGVVNPEGDDTWDRLAGAGVIVLSSFGYAVSRGRAKSGGNSGRAHAAPLMVLALLAALICSCGLLEGSPPVEYVEADRATYEAIAPEYLEYVRADASLDPTAKARRVALVESWNIRTGSAESGGGQ